MAEVRRRAARARSRSVESRALLAVLMAAVTACGSAERDRSAQADPTQGRDEFVQGCAVDSEAVRTASTLTRADLDGDGAPEDVRLTGPETACPAVVLARLGSGYVSAQLPIDAPPVTSGRAVRVPGVGPELVATRQDHPRGGYQIRVLALRDGELAELRGQDGALLPFIATDSLSTPVALACAPGRLVVTEAVAHEPPGGAFAWDVHRTTYAVQDGGLAQGEVRVLAEGVPPGRLERRYPALVRHRLFTDCAQTS